MNKKSEKNQRIQVFARCRPLNTSEKKSSSSVVEVIPEKKIVVKDRNASREFFFDKVFPPDTKQISVYKAVVAPLIQEVLMGYNCTVFAYGQTGTGKTYTMEGERNNSKCSWEDDPGAGIIPRSLHQLFEDLNKEENVEFSVHVSFLELYNEELFDLLSSNDLSKLRLYEDSSKKGSVIIQGLEEIIVNSKDEVYSILEKGTARRQTAATMLNATSSRSHTVFSVTVHIKENTIEGEELLKTGKLNLVDLAGSENVGRSGAVDKRAREAGNINQSLLTLGRVITALIEKQPHVPYRESKLTRLLQDSLGGHTKTSIIATISPALCNFDETLSTLDYATKAKSITINPEVNQKTTKRALIREYTEEIERLRKDLVALRSKEGFYIDMDNYTGLLNENTENKELIKEYTEKIEALKEQIEKIEEIFKATKEELMVTNEKLNETSHKYEKTAEKLSDTTSALAHTQKVLTQTSLERDEKQFLINIQSNTEKKLSQQAQKLLQVANETTNDVDKLHAKIDRKSTVEKTNEERCREFRKMYQGQFAILDDLVSQSEKEQTTNLLKTKEDMDKAFQSLLNHQTQTTNSLNEFVSLMVSNIEKISEAHSSGIDSQVKRTNSLLDEINSKKEMLLNKQCSFLLNKLPEFSQEMNNKCSEMKDWIMAVHNNLAEKIEVRKEVLCKRSEEKKKLICSVKESFDLFNKSFEDVLKDFEKQSTNISVKEHQFSEYFNETIMVLQSKFTEHRKEIEHYSTNRDKLFKANIETLKKQSKEKEESLLMHDDSDSLEEDKEFLSHMLINIDEFSTKQVSLHECQVQAINEFENFATENQKDEEKIISEMQYALKNNLSSISENTVSVKNSIEIVNTCLKDYANFKKETDTKSVEEIKKIISETNEDINQSANHLSTVTSHLKDEIFKRDIELEKFMSEDLLKDIPTGTTPQRKSYSYPRLLAATSPHDRIIERYRSKLATDTAAAVNLPLDSSFNELDESSISLNKSSDVVSNISYSSEDCESDSCTSSVSDASVDGGRNKENKKISKKRSRLPKILPKKGFTRPAIPASRKPFGLTNSTSTE